MDEAIIQLVKDFEKPRVRCGRDTFACTVLTGSENSAVLLALRWYMVFQIIQYLISRDNYTRCHMTLLAKKPKKMLEVYHTLLPARGWGLGTRLGNIAYEFYLVKECSATNEIPIPSLLIIIRH